MAETTLVEAFTRAGAPKPLGELLRIRPVVMDTSVLLPDVLWTTRNQERSTFLDFLDLGLVRPFAAHHVWAEVPRKIWDDAEASGIDGEAAEAVWWGEYAQRIRFVDVSGLEVPSASLISIRDGSDAPTFALAGLLAPVVVLAQDDDIQDLGIATHDWIAGGPSRR